ncbi:MAG: hypothetical protein AAFO93_03340 [Pseudomonadota bacterium]
MTFVDALGWPVQSPAEPPADTSPAPPARPRVCKPLLMGDILTARNGVPTFVTDWLEAERARDARREDAARKK